MPTPGFVTRLRAHIGHELLWLATAAGVVLDDRRERVLLGRRADNGCWDLPGGILDPGEEPADAVVREILEETAVVAVPERLTSVTVSPPFSYPNGDAVQYLELTFLCQAVGGNAQVNDSESVDVRWHRLDDLPDLADHVRRRLELALSGAQAASFDCRSASTWVKNR